MPPLGRAGGAHTEVSVLHAHGRRVVVTTVDVVAVVAVFPGAWSLIVEVAGTGDTGL